ncbi:hypothetical protein OROMI_014459 [Orobanche minor]
MAKLLFAFVLVALVAVFVAQIPQAIMAAPARGIESPPHDPGEVFEECMRDCEMRNCTMIQWECSDECRIHLQPFIQAQA